MVELFEISKPKNNDITNLELVSKTSIPDIKLFELVSSEEFEQIVEQWAYSQKNKYSFVKRTGGANDNGRDVFCFRDEKKTELEIFQCKHYDKKITLSDICVEIGKLLYYTYQREFIIPTKYYIISSKGCGPKLINLIDSPENFKLYVIKNWNKYCKEHITKEKIINLDADLKQYIINFDFSIINEITPLHFLEEFKKTKYYSEWFGLKKFKRNKPPQPSEEIQNNELTYVNKLFDAYGSVDKINIKEKSQLKKIHLLHFNIQRKCFYSAEGLKQFSRDSQPSDETFKDLQDQIVDPVKMHIISNSFKNGLQCLDSAVSVAQTLQIGNNSLIEFLRTDDRTGILHQVANEDELLKWTNENDSNFE